MPEYLSPGVYIEEFEIGARPIEGVSTSTAGFLGETERGTTKPRVVTSWPDYQRRFGSYFGSGKYLPYAVQGFFENGGQRCFIGRIVKTSATAAITRLQAAGSDALTVEAIGEGSWGNDIEIKVLAGTDSGFKLQIFYNEDDPVEEFDNLSVDESSPDYYDIKVNGRSNYILLTEEDEDTGDEPEEGHIGTAQAGTENTITLANTTSSTDDAYNGMVIEITDGTGEGQKRIIAGYTGASNIATLETNWTTNPDNTSIYSLYWILSGANDSLVHTGTAQAGGLDTITLVAEASDDDDFYSGMVIEITGGTGNGQIRTISEYAGGTREATVDEDWDTEPDDTSEYQVTEPTTLDPVDYTRTDSEQGNRKGLSGFTEIDEISILYSPNSQDISGALITHCETLKDRFAIIDAKQGEDASTLDPRSEIRETQYAAFYYPWIYIVDPQTGSLRVIPPGGYMAGIYARSDTERGVHKAPANEVVRGAKKLEFLITKGEHDLLNPRGVNVIRFFPGRGIRVWGARTLSSNTLWKYINVRRLFIFVEESIEEGTQWVVFEPNNEKLWARVRATITQFLTRVWRDGALMGTKAEEAFFVKCDRSTMTQDDIDNGRLICVIGIAPVKPAEFVIFRIAQWAGGSAVTE